MIEIPKTIREPWERKLKRAQRSISTGSIPVDVVEELISKGADIDAGDKVSA